MLIFRRATRQPSVLVRIPLRERHGTRVSRQHTRRIACRAGVQRHRPCLEIRHARTFRIIANSAPSTSWKPTEKAAPNSILKVLKRTSWIVCVEAFVHSHQRLLNGNWSIGGLANKFAIGILCAGHCCGGRTEVHIVPAAWGGTFFRR